MSEFVVRTTRLETGLRYEVAQESSKQADFLDSLVASTADVVESVRARLPAGFSQSMAGSILDGLEQAARKLNV